MASRSSDAVNEAAIAVPWNSAAATSANWIFGMNRMVSIRLF
jgi:hypothetical protein